MTEPTKKERDAALALAAAKVAEALPGHRGSVQFHFAEGKPVKVDILEAVKLSEK